MDWLKVRKGDTVTVEIITGKGGTVTGEVVNQGATTVTIGELPLSKGSLKIINHKPGYQDGDIGVLFHSDGTYFVGVYDSKRKKFYANNTVWNTTAQFSTEYENIKIIGNIKELA